MRDLYERVAIARIVLDRAVRATWRAQASEDVSVLTDALMEEQRCRTERDEAEKALREYHALPRCADPSVRELNHAACSLRASDPCRGVAVTA